MTFKCPDCGAPLREGDYTEKWSCPSCRRTFEDRAEITMKRQEKLIKLSNEFKDKFIGTYPAVGVATVMGSTEFNDSAQGRFVSRRFIKEYHRRGEYIKQLQTTIYIAFIWALIATLLWLWGPR